MSTFRKRRRVAALQSRLALAVTFSIAAVLLAGCGADHPETVPVRGRVTLGGGDWPTRGRLYFTVVEPAEGFPRRPGRADFDTDGYFEARTWEPGDGLMPGTYKVAVECWEIPPTMETGGRGPVPERYRRASSSDWQLVIKPGSAAQVVEFDVPREGE